MSENSANHNETLDQLDDLTFNISELPEITNDGSADAGSFDISELPEIPTEGTADDGFFNLPAFGEPISTFDPVESLPLLNNPDNSNSKQELESNSSMQFNGEDSDALFDTSLISFDDVPEISENLLFDISNDSQMECMNLDGSAAPMSNINVFPGPPPDRGSSSMTFNLPNVSLQNPCYCNMASLLTEPGGLLEVEERALASMEQVDSNSNGWNSPIFSINLMDWGIPQYGMQTPHPECRSCQLMRRIIHSNGIQDTKLEVHCREGKPDHAILQIRACIDDGQPSSAAHQKFEFPAGNSEYVKQFIAQYTLARRNEGWVLRHDSLMITTDLAMGGGKQAGFNIGQRYALPPSTYRSSSSTDSQENSASPSKAPKSNFAAQRERAGKIQLSDLAGCFHLPITEAAKRVGICPTVLKKICRRNGLRRWPHRKIKSIERLIATLEQTIADGNGEGSENIRKEIAMLTNERAKLCGGFIMESN